MSDPEGNSFDWGGGDGWKPPEVPEPPIEVPEPPTEPEPVKPEKHPWFHVPIKIPEIPEPPSLPEPTEIPECTDAVLDICCALPVTCDENGDYNTVCQFKLVPVAVPTAVPTAAPSGCADDTSCTSCADTCPVIETYILIDFPPATWSDGKDFVCVCPEPEKPVTPIVIVKPAPAPIPMPIIKKPLSHFAKYTAGK
ncbi:hypothetical protein ACK3TF_003323 [Chlorella vulgaris]